MYLTVSRVNVSEQRRFPIHLFTHAMVGLHESHRGRF